jgi:hypothetical protein
MFGLRLTRGMDAGLRHRDLPQAVATGQPCFNDAFIEAGPRGEVRVVTQSRIVTPGAVNNRCSFARLLFRAPYLRTSNPNSSK